MTIAKSCLVDSFTPSPMMDEKTCERPYGVEALLKDDSGNWFSMTEPR